MLKDNEEPKEKRLKCMGDDPLLIKGKEEAKEYLQAIVNLANVLDNIKIDTRGLNERDKTNEV